MPLVPANQVDNPLNLNRAHPLAVGMTFAFCASQYYSRFRAGGLGADFNMVYGQQGVWSATPGIPGSGIYSQGKTLDPGPGAKVITWSDPIATGVANGARGMSLAVLTQNEAAWAAVEQYVFGQRDSITSAVSRGIAIANDASAGSPGWWGEASDGAAEWTTNTGTSTQVEDQMTLLVLTMDFNADLSLYQDGVLKDRDASGLTLPIISGTKAFRMFNDSAAALSQFDGATAVAYAWNRPLREQEVSALYVDPYAPWRHMYLDEEGEAGLGALSTYFLVF